YAHSELYRWERLCRRDQQDAERQDAFVPLLESTPPALEQPGCCSQTHPVVSVQRNGVSTMPAQPETPGQAEMPAQPEMSVILITPDSFETLRRTVGALRRQTVRDRLELVIVGPSIDRPAIVESEVVGFAGRHIVEIGVI